MEFILTTTQKVTAIVEPVDKFGNPAQVENVVWTSSDPMIVEVVGTDSDLSKVLVSKGVGTCQVTVTADAKLGEGETPLTVVAMLTVLPAEAVSLGMKFGIPEEQ